MSNVHRSYPAESEHVEWRLATEHYHWDRVAEALESVEDLGIGLAGRYLRLYRMIEAEALTRQRSTIVAVTNWLDFEFIPDELRGRENAVIETLLHGFNSAALRLGWRHGPKTLVSILAEETDAPWTLGRYGFMADKHPYDKICLPLRAAFNSQELLSTAVHEYAHVITLNTSDGKIPRWMDEAVAETLEGRIQQSDFGRFRLNPSLWKSPRELDMILNTYDDQGAPDILWNAYRQCAVLGAHLHQLNGDQGIASLLRELGSRTFMQSLLVSAGFQTPADLALRKVYGLNVAQLFEQANPASQARPMR